MIYDENFIKEEIRCDFTVTAQRKKVWFVELEILKKFDEVCKKHQLPYFAEYGTLLGAVRHHGFIPWDDDIDIVMFRDDYARFQKIAPQEFKEPYFYQDSYNDHQIWAFSKIRDSRTSAIEFPDFPVEFHQGIFIDIHPLDDAPDGSAYSQSLLEMKREIWMTIAEPETILRHLQQGAKLLLAPDILYDLLALPIRERFRQFEDFNLSNFGKSENVDFITRSICTPDRKSQKREWFMDAVRMPFEYTNIPAPVCYDEVLRTHYGKKYHICQKSPSAHNQIFIDPDTPYTYYMQNKDKMNEKIKSGIYI